ncbi:hypothetical protein F5Y04DRAFT_148796 [Hypomontagnella monticulosa]|nr:hypothetical protein F5Y04DRAFT_148796 [Hypomontagnella monticulosa]
MYGSSSRRSACDRCKRQKQRCLRELGQQRCDRCTRMDAECTITPGSRIRNHFGGDTRPRPHKQQRYDRQWPTDTADASETVDAFLTTAITNSENGQSSMVFPPVSNEFWGSPMHGLMFSDNLNSNFASLVVNTPNQVNTHINHQPGIAHIATSQSNASSGEVLSPQIQEDGRIDAVPSPSEGAVTAQDQVAQVDGSIVEDTDAQRLSRINLNLVTLLSRIDQGSPKISLDTLIMPPDGSDNFSLTPIHSVMNSTREYIGVLSALSGKDEAPEIIPPPRAHHLRSSGPNTNGNSRVSVVQGHASLLSPENNLAAANVPPVSTANYGPRPSLDAATLLQVLTSYIYIAQLYLIIFAHAYEELLRLSSTDEPSLCPIPGIGFSDFPVQSGNLQATMFIQVVNNLFERMEGLLGVPRQFRIGIRGTETPGLLSEDELAGIFKTMALKEESVHQPARGKGGISALRQYIDGTKRLLWESIAP